MAMPNKHTAMSVKRSDCDAEYQRGKWGPARPVPYDAGWYRNLKLRLKLAWGVFTGRYDALDWEDRR